MEEDQPGSSVSFRRITKKRPLNGRKRDEPEKKKEVEKEEDEEDIVDSNDDEQEDKEQDGSDEGGPVKIKKGLFAQRNKRLRKNPLMIKSKRRGKPKDSDEESKSEESDSEEQETNEDLGIDFTVKSSKTAESEVSKDMGATKVSEVDTEHGKDFQSQFERIQKELKEKEKDTEQPGSSKEKIYRGLKMYGAKEAKDTTKGKASSGLNHFGPIRGQQFMRASVRWDYAPDICKDYKETGFCTFGDSCKFLHDRSDYKHGWEIDLEYEKQQKAKQQEEDYTIHSDED